MLVDIHSHLLPVEGIFRIHSASLTEWHNVGSPLDVPCSLGIHPWDVLSIDDFSQSIACLESKLNDSNVVMVGEIGMDKVCHSPWDLQLKYLTSQLQLASERHLPVVIHCVKAMDSILAVKKKFPDIPHWILHGFRGKAIQMNQWLSNGFWISFGHKFDTDSISQCPLERMFLETDDGGCELSELYQSVSSSRGCSLDTLEAQIEVNVHRIGL